MLSSKQRTRDAFIIPQGRSAIRLHGCNDRSNAQEHCMDAGGSRFPRAAWAAYKVAHADTVDSLLPIPPLAGLPCAHGLMHNPCKGNLACLSNPSGSASTLQGHGVAREEASSTQQAAAADSFRTQCRQKCIWPGG